MTTTTTAPKLSTANVTRVLNAAGWTQARWNKNTERVYNTGFITTLETWTGHYVSVTYDFAGHYRNLNADEIATANAAIGQMAINLMVAGFDVQLCRSYDNTTIHLAVTSKNN